MTTMNPATFDPKLFRDVMGHYPTGVAVVTGRGEDGEVLALVVGTFSSVSLDPPLVSFMPMKTSRTFQKLRSCSSLCINILGGDQEAEVMKIAQRWEKKLEGIDWFPSPSGDPVLRDSVSWIDTRISEVVEAGDHWIVLCEVKDMEVTNPVTPLLFFQGGYGSFVGTSMMDRMSSDILPSIHAAHAAHEELENLADEIGCEVTVTAAVSQDELATIYSTVGDNATKEAGLADRLPLVPPIGDSVVFAQPEEFQERWLGKIRDASDEFLDMLRGRLEYLRTHGYVVAFLPETGSKAYEKMVAATKEYKKARLTPAQERAIRDAIYRADEVDYQVQEIVEDKVYDMAAIAFPVRDPHGDNTMTLRLAQLPSKVSGETVLGWIELAKKAIQTIESKKENE